MQICVTAIICTLIFTILVSIIFFSKKRINLAENKIYAFLLIISSIGLVLELLCCYFVYNKDVTLLHGFINNVVCKLFLVYMLTWLISFAFYIYYISFKQKNKILEIPNVLKIIYCIFLLIVIILPIEYYSDGIYVYSYGMGPNFVTFIGATTIIYNLYCIIKNHKSIKDKKYYPVYILIFLMIIALILRNVNPGLVLINSIFGFITGLMYFTIENPDVQMVNELYKNKVLVEKTYEEKSNFLFKMTQEVKKPINNMKNILESLKSSDDITELKQGIKLLESNSKQMDFIVNDVLDITTLDSRNIKIMNNRYNVYTVFKDIEKRMQEYASENVEFRFNIDENIPYLYGDSIKLKQIIMSVLLNSIKKTTSGFIELSIEAIVKYDVCRLIIEVEDSGVGMSIDKINEVLVTTSELSVDDIKNLEKLDINLKLCQKSIKLLGGNLMIRSEEGKGTEVIITIDQKIFENKSISTELESYENALYNASKVLVVSDKEEDVERIKKIINDDNVLISSSFYGNDAVMKIKSGKGFDLIIMDDELPIKSGLTILRELKEIDKFDVPVVVMLGDNKKEIKEHYLKDGFSDYILRDNMNEEIKRIVNKYL